MTPPVPVRGEVTFRFISPGVQGPIERSVVFDLDQGLVTAPDQLKRLDFESDCLTHIERWFNKIKNEKRTLAKQLESVAYTSAILREVLGVVE